MAIPNRTTITCPACGTSENVIIVDCSVGPRGRVSQSPIYMLHTGPLWTQTDRDGETYLSCTTCGEAEFITLAKQARIRRRGGSILSRILPAGRPKTTPAKPVSRIRAGRVQRPIKANKSKRSP